MNNLIFVISQPRAGSTLLQRMLACHSQIYSVGEPWLMLHPLYGLKDDGVKADFNTSRARLALNEFVQQLPGKGSEYYEGLRLMGEHIYNSALAGTGKTCFLDKTPRYYFIISELSRTFPDAKFIFLHRNPLSILASMCTTWATTRFLFPYDFKHDLLSAPRLILEGEKLLGKRACIIRYESLVESPESELQRLFDYLNMPFEKNIIEYGKSGDPKWLYGDNTNINRYDKPENASAAKWVDFIDSPQNWRFAHDYVRYLGPGLLDALGYPYDVLMEEIQRKKPSGLTALFTLSLVHSLKGPELIMKPVENMYERIRAFRRKVLYGDKSSVPARPSQKE